MKRYEFDALIIKNEKYNSGYIEFPYNTEIEFGKKGQIKVKALFDNFLYRGSLVKMGHPCHIIGLNKEVRNAIGKQPGEFVHVVIVEDKEERYVEIPSILEEALNKHPKAKNRFEKYSYSHKKEYVAYLLDAKKEETRNRRIEKIIEKLLSINK